MHFTIKKIENALPGPHRASVGSTSDQHSRAPIRHLCINFNHNTTDIYEIEMSELLTKCHTSGVSGAFFDNHW